MDLMQEQTEIEALMADRGISRYHRLAAEAVESGEATRNKSVQTVMDTGIVAVVEALQQFLDSAKTGKAGRRHTAIKRLAGIDLHEAAFVSLRIALDGISRDAPLTPVAVAIGRALELEARLDKLAETQAAYVKKMMTNLDGRTRHVGHRRAVLSKVLREKGDEWDAWGERDNLQTGLKLLELIVESTGLFEIKLDSTTARKTQQMFVTTARFRDWLATLDHRFALMSPDYLPCVVPPKDWTDFNTGAYHTDALAYPPTLVKTSSKLHREALKKADLSKVLKAVNAIQCTPWSVNHRVLEVIETLIAQGRELGGMPSMENIPLPIRPADIDTNVTALHGWKRDAAGVYEANRKVSGRRVGMLRSISVAREFSKYDAIYFPYQLDFRGRVYPIPQGLNPQGNDLAKGLLHFSVGEPLGDLDAIRWFEIHGANCFGVDKVDFAERMDWVEANFANIIRSAENPLDYQWWADADSPFCFLAWCFEYNDYVKHLSGGGSTTYFVSRIPVAMDGSCNGLQHYSAMLRDPRGGEATNLTPSAKPQDIYGEVAKVTMKALALAAQTPSERLIGTLNEAVVAAAWGNWGIDRKITKRPVMVLPYGGTLLSCMDYVGEAVRERGDYPFTDEQLHKASVYLSGVVWGSIGEVVVAARLAMGWLKEVASVVSKENLPIKWTTPSGFPVVQAYPEMKSHQIECRLFGARFQPSLDVASKTAIDRRRQSNGVAPNFVHSLDASALIDTVNRAVDQGVTKFAMIHDSYGTTAGSSVVLAKALREAFVCMYEEHDVLEEFLHAVVPAHLQGDIKSPPFVGGLDLKEVHNSRYFFA